MICSVALMFFLQAKQATASKGAGSNPIVRFIQAASDILDSGPALWDKIGKFQADAAVQTVTSGATTIETDKRVLRDDILSGKIRTSNELSARVISLQRQLVAFRSSLDKFAIEIDKSSKNTGDDIRSAANYMIESKGSRLDSVETFWQPGDPSSRKEAAQQLDAAIVCSQEIATAATCLQNTIKNGKRDPTPQCSVESLKSSMLCDVHKDAPF